MDKTLEKYYYDEEKGFTSAKTLYKRLKEDGHKFTLKQVSEFIDKQLTRQLTRQPKKQKIFQSIISPSVNNNYQIDIMIYNRYEYHNYKYILCVIDVYSRYAQARALTTRSFPVIMKNLEDIFYDMGVPTNINADREFDTHEFNKYCSDNGINVYYSFPDEVNKNAIVERFNRTLADLLQRWRVGTGQHDWYRVLPKIIKNYNKTDHRTIKAKPSDVFNGKDINKQDIVRIKQKLAVGDSVRRKIVKQTFDKGDVIKYSRMVYKIMKIDKNKFYLEDDNDNEIDRPFKSYELSKIIEVQHKPDDEEEIIHEEVKQVKKIAKEKKKAGVDDNNVIVNEKRKKKLNTMFKDYVL